jgi:LysM repeat protein
MESGQVKQPASLGVADALLTGAGEVGAGGKKGAYAGVSAGNVLLAVDDLKQGAPTKIDNNMKAGYDRLVTDLRSPPPDGMMQILPTADSYERAKSGAVGVSGPIGSQAPPMMPMIEKAQKGAAMLVEKFDARMDKLEARLNKMESEAEIKPNKITEVKAQVKSENTGSNEETKQSKAADAASASAKKSESPRVSSEGKEQKAYDSMERVAAKDGKSNNELAALDAFADKYKLKPKDDEMSLEELIRALIAEMQGSKNTDNISKALREVIAKRGGQISLDDAVKAFTAMASDDNFSDADLAAFKDLLALVGDGKNNSGASPSGGGTFGGGAVGGGAPTFNQLLDQLFVAPNLSRANGSDPFGASQQEGDFLQSLLSGENQFETEGSRGAA